MIRGVILDTTEALILCERGVDVGIRRQSLLRFLARSISLRRTTWLPVSWKRWGNFINFLLLPRQRSFLIFWWASLVLALLKGALNKCRGFLSVIITKTENISAFWSIRL